MTELMHGHLWTLLPAISDMAARPRGAGRPWRATAHDELLGKVLLSGYYDAAPGASTIVVLVHGLAGTANRGYVVRAARTARALGLSSLRLNLRGADGSGEDFYHAGMAGDVAAAIASPEVQRYPHRVVLGFSLGGHIVLRYASSPAARGNVSAAAALCSPLDLDASCRHIDSSRAALYREYLLVGLKRHYAQVARRRGAPLRPDQLRAIRSVRQWDERVIAPRFGFDSAEHYYRSQSVAPSLASLCVPSLLCATERDPMVAADTVRPHLGAGALEVQWLRRGGHVGFPPNTDPVPRLLDWLRSHSESH